MKVSKYFKKGTEMLRLVIGLVLAMSSSFAYMLATCEPVTERDFNVSGKTVHVKFDGVECITATSFDESVLSQELTNAEGKKFKLPFGDFMFDANTTQVGGQVTVTLTMPYTPGIVGYMKKKPDHTWVDVGSAANVQQDSENNKTVVTFTLSEGGQYDADGVANGRLRDPGGPYILVQSPPQSQEVSVPFSPWTKVLIIIGITLIVVFKKKRIV